MAQDCERIPEVLGASIHSLLVRPIPVSRSLNRIQSKIYQTAFHSNVNLLVCAPTGAGKTNIAMTAVLHEVRFLGHIYWLGQYLLCSIHHL